MEDHKNVQSVIFKISDWHKADARQWLKKYGFISDGKAHSTFAYHRFRQFDPKFGDFYITKDIGNGIKLVIVRK